MLLLSRIKNGYDSSATAMYFERFWFTEALRAVFQESYEYYIQCSLYMPGYWPLWSSGSLLAKETGGGGRWEGWNTKTVFWIEMTDDWDAGLLWKGSGTVGSGPNTPPPPCFLCTIWWLDNLRSIKKIMRDKIANFTASNVHYPQLACTLRNESEVKWFIKRKK